MLDGTEFKEVFDTCLPLFRAAQAARYVSCKCCKDPQHITKYEEEKCIDNIALAVRARGI